MPITNLPTFEDGEILAAGKLNQLRDAVETKFSGAIAGGDIAWPLVAQGNLDMAGFEIAGVQSFRNVLDATQYDTLQAAIDAAEATSGGAVFIPANTTFEVSDLTIESNNIVLFGAGDTSVIKLATGATAGQLLSTSSNLSGIRLMNLKFDGNSGEGTSQAGVKLIRTVDAKVINCTFDDFSGNCLWLTNDGVAGNACTDTEVRSCRFLTSDAAHFLADDVDGLLVEGCVSKTSGAGGFDITAAGAASKIRRVQVASCKVKDSTDEGIKIAGSGAAVTSDQINCQVIGCEVDTTTGTTKDAFLIGTDSLLLDRCVITGNRALSATGRGFGISVEESVVSGNMAHGNAGDGFEFDACTRVGIASNGAFSNTGNGIAFVTGTCDRIGLDANTSYGNGGTDYFNIINVTNLKFGPGNQGGSGLADISGFTLDGVIEIDGSDGDEIQIASVLGLEDAIRIKQDGCPYPVVVRGSVSQNGAATQTIDTVPSGQIWLIKGCVLQNTSAWDGSGFDLDIGVSGGDTDGFYDGSGASFAGTVGVEAADPDDLGVLLFDSVDAHKIHYVVDATAGDVDLIATVTAGTGTAGNTTVFLEVVVLEGKST